MEKPRRRFWQIHLSTAVVMMLAGSVLVWLNSIGLHSIASPGWDPGIWYSNDTSIWTHPRADWEPEIDGPLGGVRISVGKASGYGWPFIAVIRPVRHGPVMDGDAYEIQWAAALRDVLIGAVLMLLVAGVVEYLVRRRSAPR